MVNVLRGTCYESNDMKTIIQWICLHKDLIKDTHHIPNEGKRSKIGGYNLKLMGLTPGFSDLFIAIPNQGYHGLFIELKSMRKNGKYGKATDSQLKFIDRKNEMGYYATVCYGVDESILTIEKYLKVI